MVSGRAYMHMFSSTQRVYVTWFSWIQLSRSVVSDSLRPCEWYHARPPCPSPTPEVYPNSSPSSRCCHPAISSSVVPFSSCPQPLPASGSFPMSQLFASGGQSIGVSASASEGKNESLVLDALFAWWLWDVRHSQVARLVQGDPLLSIHFQHQSEDVYSLGSGERWT